MTPNGILQISDLRFAYPQQAPVVSGWSATIGAGLTLLYGDTGSGKSTLLRVLAGDVAPTAGRLAVQSIDLHADAQAYRRHVFFCDPSDAAVDAISARACTDRWAGDHAAFDRPGWQALAEGFGLLPHLDKPMYMLSTGSKRKVGLAAALASQRPVTLLDEPAGALDAPSLRCLWRALAELAVRPDRAVVIASSDRIDRVPLAATISLPLLAQPVPAR